VKEQLSAHESSRPERAAAIERMLLPLLNRDTPAAPSYLSRAVERIRLHGGCTRIGKLCEEIGITARQLQREFDRWIGIPVKFYCRVVRVNRALEYLERTSGPCDYAELAADLGYYDQAHLCGEFAELVGMTQSQIHFGGMQG
jgi:AraC-like DNA-binding protein